jgi:hypothetical protein
MATNPTSKTVFSRALPISIVADTPSRRKFAKLKVKFEGAMKASNALVKEELRIVDLARRLKEQNEYAYL